MNSMEGRARSCSETPPQSTNELSLMRRIRNDKVRRPRDGTFGIVSTSEECGRVAVRSNVAQCPARRSASLQQRLSTVRKPTTSRTAHVSSAVFSPPRCEKTSSLICTDPMGNALSHSPLVSGSGTQLTSIASACSGSGSCSGVLVINAAWWKLAIISAPLGEKSQHVGVADSQNADHRSLLTDDVLSACDAAASLATKRATEVSHRRNETIPHPFRKIRFTSLTLGITDGRGTKNCRCPIDPRLVDLGGVVAQ